MLKPFDKEKPTWSNYFKMKNLLFIFPDFVLMLVACAAKEKETRWAIKKDNPEYGLTLGYLFPLNQIQKIVGYNNYHPRLYKA